MIAQWFATVDQGETFPELVSLQGRRTAELRYGENPHQKAALYTPVGPHISGIAQAEQVQGKELSYNNYNDADAAFELTAEFKGQDPAVVIVKHANPCGVAQAPTLLEAWQGALACDDVSAFGGIVSVNTRLDGADGGGNLPDLHRSRHRPRCRRRCPRILCQKEEPAPAADR